MASVKPSHHRWEDIPREELINQIERRIVTGEQAMLAQVFLKQGSVVPMHDHPNDSSPTSPRGQPPDGVL